ncbi:MAG: SUMF1/EgtB/PvdO family nonheme iron enzyme [Fibromonadaceae bacterium]|jgi:hypothetical protein|nr:SUMF1/EgtB/PvdO family nonheme iron enzyme [Fibromonadaceae bacterium]
MRAFAFYFAFFFSSLFASGERASLGIFTVPEGADVFLDNSQEKEGATPYENSAMLRGEHFVKLLPPSESFVPAFYDVVLYADKGFEINHEFLRRNQAFEAYTPSPSEFHIEVNSGYWHFHSFDSNSFSKIPWDFRIGLPAGFGARLKFPVQEREIKEFILGMQYNYFPLQIGLAIDRVIPRGPGNSAIRTAIFAEQDVQGLVFLENLVYEYARQGKAEFYLRAGLPIKHVFLPYLTLREKIHLPLKSHLLSIEPGALLQAWNKVSLELAIPLAFIGEKSNKGFGFYFGIHADFAFEKKIKKSNSEHSVIWDVNEVSNNEYRKFCEETGREVPALAKMEEYGDYPVLSVDLQDAIEYSKWAKKRLPTIEEWKALAQSYSNFDEICEASGLKKVHEGRIVNGVRNFAGNAAIWLYPESISSSFANFAGSSYGDPPEACKRKANLTDISFQSGNKFIGIRLVKDF